MIGPPKPVRRGDAAFTLIEALAALFVFAMAGAALAQLQAHSALTLARVEAHALASAAAQNALVDALAANPGAEVRKGRVDISYAGRRWAETVELAPTEAGETVRVTVRVASLEGPGKVAVEVHGFLTQPAAPAAAPAP